MSSRSLPPSPEKCIVVGFGGTCLDYLAAVATFPKRGDKIQCRSMKIADDNPGKSILEELTADGVDTSFLMVVKDGQTPFSYVIVNQSTKARTSIFTPGFPVMEPADISQIDLKSALIGARFVYFDARHTDTAIVVAQEAAGQNIPILLDAEKESSGLDSLLLLTDYVICSAKFLQAWTGASSLPSALISILLRLPKLKFAIMTLGELGCLMLERSSDENPLMEEEDADSLLHSLEQKMDESVATPMCIPSVMCFSNRRKKSMLVCVIIVFKAS